MEKQEKQVQLKNYNRRTVLNYIKKNGTGTKAGIAAFTGLTFMAIKKILEELEELGLIRCAQLESRGLGRRALSFVVNENYKYTIGIHINKYSTNIALLNLVGKIVNIRRCSMEDKFTSQSEFVDMLIDAVEKVIVDSNIVRTDILGIGVGAPGPVDCVEGVILTPPNIPILQYLPLKEILENRTKFPIYVNKDVNVIALCEYCYGSMKGYDNLAYVDVDMGIGSGFIIDGKLNIGANHMAGEFGHITIDINGPLCNCGNKGCLEAFSSGIAILRDMKQSLEKEDKHMYYQKREELTIDDIFTMVEQKDMLAISVLNQSAFYLGVAVSNLINILDSGVVILGGILIQKYPRYFSIVQDVAQGRKMRGHKENKLAVSILKENAGVIGAGEVVAEHFFEVEVNNVF
jgi:predicted NBD/HSP70 family sugar kinase